MAKKKSDTQTTPATDSTNKGPGMTKVVNKALDALGVEASIRAVEEWVQGEFPTFAYNRNTLSSTLSQQRNKRRGGSMGTGSRAFRREMSHSPSMDDLFTVKRFADEHGGMAKLVDMVQSVHGLAEKVGGMDRLKKCLNGLEKLGG